MRTLTAMQDARRTNKEGRRRRVGSEFVGLSLSLSSDFYLFFSSVSKVIFFDHSWCRNNIIVSFQTEQQFKSGGIRLQKHRPSNVTALRFASLFVHVQQQDPLKGSTVENS